MSDRHTDAAVDPTDETTAQDWPVALLDRLGTGELRCALTFAGQGNAWLDELARLHSDSEAARRIIEAAADELAVLARSRAFAWSGLYDRGFDLRKWMKEPDSRPDPVYLSASPISQPGVFTTQIAHFAQLHALGLAPAFETGGVVATTGHSQGIMAAALVAEAPDLPVDRFIAYLRYVAWQGHYMQTSFDVDEQVPDATPMAAVSRLDRQRLQAVLDRVNATVPEAYRASISLENTRDRSVVSGPASTLERLRLALEHRLAKDRDLARAGRTADGLPDFTWEYLGVTTAFHSGFMARGLDQMRATVAELGFTAGPFRVEVVDCATGEALDAADPVDALLRSQFTSTVRWEKTICGLGRRPGLSHVIDLGPGDGVARLSAVNLRGRPVHTIAFATPGGREAVRRPAAPAPLDYAALSPRLARLPDGRTVVDNRFTRATGCPPVLLPGMTPTTVDCDIVAAAANGGFVAELAGGGQVTDRHLRLRLEELADKVDPGARVVFNALYLDAYLWRLHLGERKLVQRLVAQGAPICGVTVSAGIPPVDDAVALLDELEDLGIWLNALKPGTPRQVRQVLDIARARPGHPLFLHLEGGKAGGHHSWSGLDALLLATYDHIRQCDDVILCVGGGIADEGRAVELLTGRWAERYGLDRRPVDAVFLGTVTMACAEASTSPQVKRALVDAAGTEDWVFNGEVRGGVTSGRSQLDADIHYLDTAAARCGRLLDRVAGDADAVAAHRDEIAAALDQTAKPYFGDLDAMTWHRVLSRMVELMAVGRHDRYEDGIWPDVTFRARFADMVHRAEARLDHRDEGTFPSAFDAFDDPHAVVADLVRRYPAAAAARLHPLDVEYFVAKICRRPGKPVPFVPVIDADVRRWYKADSLWQAHDDRFSADQVLVIPGPEAVRGIRRADEPVAELLGRFDDALKAELVRGGTVAVHRDRLPPPVAPVVPPGVRENHHGDALVLEADATGDWFAYLAHRPGPIGALFATRDVHIGRRRRDNPVRALCPAVPGARLRLERDRAIYEHRSERVVLTASGARVRVEIHPTLAAGAAATFAFDAEDRGSHVAIDGDAWRDDLAAFYHQALFGEALAPVDLFDTAEETVVIEADRVRGYRSVTGARPTGPVTADMVFSLGWRCLFQVLSCAELRDGLLRLVHLSNEVVTGPAWPPAADERVEVVARITRVTDADAGRTVHARVDVGRDGAHCASLTSVFFIRDAFAHTPHRVRAHELVSETVILDADAARFLSDHRLVALDVPIAAGDTIAFDATLDEHHPRHGPPGFAAEGTLRRGTTVVGRVVCDEAVDASTHPVRALLTALGPDESAPSPATRTLATGTATAPDDMEAFAWVGRDHNPIHTSGALARLAGLSQPIAHGMWTAARARAFVAAAVSDRFEAWRVEFLSPVLPGQDISLTATRRHAHAGGLAVEVTATVDGRPVLRGTATVAAPRTAYVFPGQGVQRQGMGMDGYGRSAAARKIWDRADAYTREHLGFSVLQVVRDNPRRLRIGAETLRHPEGVLHLTQLTQVSMAVLAQAQVAELREADVLAPNAIAAGHSVGEYNALGALIGVLPLEAVIEVVWQRGLAMHTLVARDDSGESGYRMGVVRPHYAGLDHRAAEGLVARIREETGAFVQIVNYNVRGRQYAVTGQIAALRRLEAELVARQTGAKPAWVEVPGIDVPFHSERLRPGVDAMRGALEAWLPDEIDPDRLVGRYIPNLVPRLFTLDRAYVTEVAELTASPVLARALDRFDDLAPGALCRTLLVELLSYQFASPVRWIETQDLLLRPTWRGGVGLEQIIEVGVGYQPTLANMARYSARLDDAAGVRILNAEADAEELFLRDRDPAPVEEADEEDAPAADAPAATLQPATAPVATSADAPRDVPVPIAEALRSIVALQARVRFDQVAATETLDAVFDGVSSRVNQILLDVGAEFDVGAIDNAQQLPVDDLVARLETRCVYRQTGPYLKTCQDDAIKHLFGPVGWTRRDVTAHLEHRFGFGPGLVQATLNVLALDAREGASTRGGDLGSLAPATSKGDARKTVEAAADKLAARRGFALPAARGAATATAVDPAAAAALASQIIGPDGVLMSAVREVASQLGHPVDGDETPETAQSPASILDPAVERLLQPAFDARRHVALTSGWAWAHRDVAALAFAAGNLDDDQILAEGRRLSSWSSAPRVRGTAAWYRRTAEGTLADALDLIATDGPVAPVAWAPTGPDGAPRGDLGSFVNELPATVEIPGWTDAWCDVLTRGNHAALDYRGRTALVTGAGKQGIATEIVRHLLRGGARVVVTTSSFSRERIATYRQIYAEAAGPGAELHVVPFNQGSLDDVDALLDWMFTAVTERAGAAVKTVKPAWVPDILVPFAAIKDLATVDTLGPRAEVALRAMLLSVERLIGGVASRLRERALADRCHVLLPLSPNLGIFGGDGMYAETKAALEVLAAKWHSEHDAWGRHTTLVPARIGWVRGTGLMDANDPLAVELEARTDVRTWSAPEMGYLLAALLTDEARHRATEAPLHVDLSAGLGDLPDLRGLVDAIRADLEAAEGAGRGTTDLADRERAALGVPEIPRPQVAALPSWSPVSGPAFPDTASGNLEDMVVLVGLGEIGPCGSSRTRYELEVDDALSAAGVTELAWVTGLVRYDEAAGGWVDADSGDPVDEADIAGRYRDAVRERVGIRFTEAETAGFDPEASPLLATAWLDRDFTFPVGSEEEARAFKVSDPDHTRVRYDADADTWRVTRTAGSAVRVPRTVRLSRRVSGQIPTGFDFARYGIPAEMIERVDRVSLFNLVATVEAFLTSGFSPEELLAFVHPVRVANTQGAGIGGMNSLRRMYLDPVLGAERQKDILQETLINVVASYAAQTYVGSYGAMSNPVSACATAAVSLEQGVDKILTGKADFVVTGGVDDISTAGTVGFGDMNATADTDEMLALGLAPDEMSRANDTRRKGFVEAHGGGTALLARADLAVEMGLPVLGVVAWAGTFSDGVHSSIPAPGLGALAAAMGGERSPLGRALSRYGMSADDIGIVYKHDTSTAANDPNENALHHAIQKSLGRTPGNPLFVASQKALTGHSKGGAAAWQLNGLCQSLAAGVVPGNRNLTCVDPEMAAFDHLLFSDRTLRAPQPFRAGLLTSLGFGHVSAIALILHPDAFLACVPDDAREAYAGRVADRLDAARREWLDVLLGRRQAYTKRSHRRFSDDGPTEEEVLLDAGARLGPDGTFVRGAGAAAK